MEIPFNASPAQTLGIEVELNLVDLSTRALRNASHELIAALGRGFPGGEHPKIKHELLQCTVEVITGICDTPAEARRDLQASIDTVASAAADRGLALICSGTHPFTHWQDLEVSPDDRYRQLIEVIGWPARRMAICGIHYHVGVPSAEHAISLLQPLAYHLPLFVALSGSSPYWNGRDTNMASARTKIFEGLPTAGLPPQLNDWADFEQFMTTLLQAKVIATIREVWWDVRPHPNFGTVELRMCDGMTNLTEVTALGALAQCLVADLTARIDRGEATPQPREWVLRENKWLAARYGKDTSLIVDDDGTRVPIPDLVTSLVDDLRPTADRLGCTSELEQVLDMVQLGPSYQRQRSVLAGGGSHTDVVDLLIAEFAQGAPLR